jgi:hypothetical protein
VPRRSIRIRLFPQPVQPGSLPHADLKVGATSAAEPEAEPLQLHPLAICDK